MTLEQREELKPCPFCGGPVTLERAMRIGEKGARDWWGIKCRNTMNLGGTCAIEQIPSGSPEAAIGRWNRRAQVEALTVPQWQPIETAPRDGTLILLGRTEDEENDRGSISTPGRWHEGDDDGPDNMGHDAGFMDDEFQQFAWGRSFGNSAYKNGGFQPTHWQPIPAAPTIPAIPGTKEGA